MKLIIVSAGFILLCLWSISELAGSSSPATTATAGTTPTPVVVELFTSEGCSSCPPADALLSRLFKEQPVDGAEIIAIEEHVDYWDSLGWKDPFSSSKWTLRQQEYAEAFKNGSVYTPQMVVDGQVEVVGSRASESIRKISEDSRRDKTQVTLSPNGMAATGSRQYAIRVGKLVGSTNGDTAEVWLAVAEDNLESSVTRGENAGEQLRHTSVLRSLRKIGVAEANKDQSFSGNTDVRLDPAWKPESTRIIALVQERKSRKVLGAAKAELTR